MAGPRPWAVRQMGPPARTMWWWALRAGGMDVTVRSAGRTCLVLAAHPDDETLGCAATIMRKRDAGTSVVLVVATDGSASSRSHAVTPEALAGIRADETVTAAALMGIAAEHVIRLGFEDTHLDRDERPVCRLLVELIDRHRPDDVLVTSAGDPHPDHAALGRAAREALTVLGGQSIRLIEYPIWQWRSPGSWLRTWSGTCPGGGHSILHGPRPELVSTKDYIERKRRVLATYQSQISNLTGEPGWWSLDHRLLVNFFRSHEVFFPVPLA